MDRSFRDLIGGQKIKVTFWGGGGGGALLSEFYGIDIC